MSTSDRFRELAVEVLREVDGPLPFDVIRERVLDLAKSKGKSITQLSSIGHRKVHFVLRFDERRRFKSMDTEPSSWE